MKKIIVLFELLLLVTHFCAQAQDFSAVYNGKTIYYNLHDDGGRYYLGVTSGPIEYSGDIIIPESVNLTIYGEIPVEKIEYGAFHRCSGLTSVTIGNSITTIESAAFGLCSGLTSLTIPNSVTFIWDNVFRDCSGLTSVTIPNSVERIMLGAFHGCSSLTNVNYKGTIAEWCGITFGDIEANPTYYAHTLSFNGTPMGSTLTIPNSVTIIGKYAFDGCSGLTSVTIPNSVERIMQGAFHGCSSLTNVNYKGTIAEWCGITFDDIEANPTYYAHTLSFNGTPMGSTLTIPNSVTIIGKYAFEGCSGLTSVTIPNSVTSIGSGAFSGCSGLTNVNYTGTIAEWCGISFGVGSANPTVGSANPTYYAHTLSFNGTPMGNILTIPNSVTSIGSGAFSGCSGLTSVTIPNSVITIGEYAFNQCSGLTSVTIGNSVTTIGSYAFRGCSNVDTLYYNAKNLVTTATGSSSNDGFRPMALHHLVIGDSVQSLPVRGFSNQSGLTSVTIPNSVTSIGYGAFDRCSGLTSITIPNSVTSIGPYAFYYCSGLTSVTIGNSVTTIESEVFTACSNLKTVYNLSRMTFTYGSTSNGYVAYKAKRVVNCTEHSGSGDNIIYKIPTSYTFVDVEDNVETHIPRSTIPTNFIYYDNSAKDGGSWKAKNIVLTDGQDAFEVPETFTAETATYTREFTNSNRSTLYLPFTAAIPEDFEVYDFTNFANNTISFTKREDSIYAYTPYLVGYDLSKDGNTTTCTITKTNAVFPKSESANYHPVTRNGMTFQGVLERTEMTSTNNYGYSNGFFVQSGGHAHVNPFRSYFTYTAPAGAPQSLPPTLNVEVGYGDPVGIDAVETPEQEYDGRYGKDVYDMLGRLVRKNADNLEGLPRGIYLWKGKKFMNYDL